MKIPFCRRLLRPVDITFWKLVDETQMSKPPEPTRHHNSTKSWILLSLRADLLCILQCKFIVKKTGDHKSIQVCLHFNWCAPAGKIENMHWQCRSPKGTLHCSNMRHPVSRSIFSTERQLKETVKEMPHWQRNLRRCWTAIYWQQKLVVDRPCLA